MLLLTVPWDIRAMWASLMFSTRLFFIVLFFSTIYILYGTIAHQFEWKSSVSAGIAHARLFRMEQLFLFLRLFFRRRRIRNPSSSRTLCGVAVRVPVGSSSTATDRNHVRDILLLPADLCRNLGREIAQINGRRVIAQEPLAKYLRGVGAGARGVRWPRRQDCVR